MPYALTSDFKFGMDRRRPRVAGVPGTLWTLRNCVISRGGDIQRARKWDIAYSLPRFETSAGLASLGDRLFIFGQGTRPASLSPAVGWQRVAYGSSIIERVLDAKAFAGSLYSIIEYADGNIAHFYGDTQVTDWDTIADASSSFEAVAERLAEKLRFDTTVDVAVADANIILTASVPGVAFTCSAGATDNVGASTPTATAAQYQANVPYTAPVGAEATIEVTAGTSGTANVISQVTVSGQNLLAAAVPWVLSHAATANALAAAINAYSATSGYTADISGSIVSILAEAADGSGPNGILPVVTFGGNTGVTVAAFAGGVDEVEAVAQIYVVEIGTGTFDAEDSWSVTVNGTTVYTTGRAAGMATAFFVQKSRLWAPTRRQLRYCVLDDPEDWSTTSPTSTGAGFIDLSSETGKSARLVGGGEYAGLAAIFSRDDIPIYQLDADADNIIADRPVTNAGTVAPRSITSFGNIDTFFLDFSGIRSLKSRDGYDAAFISDIGSVIDPYIQDLLTTTPEAVVERAMGVLERRDSRYLLAIGDKILVLSYFPSSKITAWSYLDAPGTVDEVIDHRGALYLRAGDEIYRYGGFSGEVYPSDTEYPAVVETPFMSANDPAAHKMLKGFDSAASNTWALEMLVDPNDETKVIALGAVDRITYPDEKAAAIGKYPLVAFKFTCNTAGYASLSNFAVHFDKDGPAR